MNHLKKILLIGLSLAAFHAQAAAPKPADYQVELPASSGGARTFTPPSEEQLPKGAFGDVVRYGRDLFMNTDQLRGKYTGNGMRCVNCHLDQGRKPDSAPLWGAYTMYPAYRQKNGRVNTMEERIQGCFRFSMNGTPPPSGSKELTALLSYHYWLSTGAPVGVALPGRGYPKLAKPAKAPDAERGRVVYEAQCAMCHGATGAGQMVDGQYVFPPLWGKESYNWGAGMHRINTAAGFIKANMPFGKSGSLSDQEAWDVARFINSQERPADPRALKTIAETDKVYHDENCTYGDHVHGQPLGKGAGK